MKTLLVTGGCGFIGSNFIRYFLNQREDWSILNIDKITYSGNLENLKEFSNHKRYQFERGDICDKAFVERAIRKADAVINFAAETHVDRSIDHPEDFIQTNLIGAHTILEAARKRKIQKFIQISTDEVYGSLNEGSADENYHLKPNSPYAASKAGADLMARAYDKTYRYPIVIARASNNFGPYQFPEKVIPLFVTNLLEGKKIPVYGTGKNQRDWLFVEDNCRALEILLDKGMPGEIYNIAGGHEIENMELARTLLELMGQNEKMIQMVEDRPGHDWRYSLDSKKLKALGFAPRKSFRDALQQTIDWYKQNKEWWTPLKRDKFTLK